MSVNGVPDMDEPTLQYRQFVYRFALQLSNEDCKALAWIYKHSGVSISSSTCAIDILTKLEEYGYFSAKNPQGLAEVAKSVCRRDLEVQVKDYIKRMSNDAKKSISRRMRNRKPMQEGKYSVATHDILAQATAVVSMLEQSLKSEEHTPSRTKSPIPPKPKMLVYNWKLFSAYEALLQHITVLMHLTERIRTASTKQDPEEQRILGAQASGNAIPHVGKIEQQLKTILSDCGMKAPSSGGSSETSPGSDEPNVQLPPSFSSHLASLQLADLADSRGPSPTYETIADPETEEESDDEESLQPTCSAPVPESNELHQEARLPVFAKDLPRERPIYTFLRTHCMHVAQREQSSLGGSEPTQETHSEKQQDDHQNPEPASADGTGDSGFTDLLPLLGNPHPHFVSTTELGPKEQIYMSLLDSAVNQDPPYANTVKTAADQQHSQ